ncbi:hypothetical protein PH213_20495 [Streptomyces sp. SRF1]|uniref:hypothetical protein n=1 Tax=Streptomyces sp. SRF1 TaxID=1549642 RepID=UPI0025AFBAE6|nr:hypothetical protein [Streptomyces sp. SRF1]MDN3056887.1 hypothetical protein [Streptomyces sp. SRF1]
MDLRPRALLGRLNDLADRIDPDGQQPGKNDEKPAPNTAPDNADTVPSKEADTAPVSTDAEDEQPSKPTHGGARLPNWWEPKGDLTDTKKNNPPVTAAHRTPAEDTEDKEPCVHPNPHAVHARPTGELVAYWCENCETQLEVLPEEDGDEEAGEDGDQVPARLRDRWRRSNSATRIYQRPTYWDTKPAPRQNLIGWWLGLSAPTRWLVYNGTALGVGAYLGVPQFFTAETAYLVHTYGSWSDWHVCIWYGVAMGVWAIDARTRGWFPLFALGARVPLVSMVVGCLLYGSTDLTL